MKASKESRFCPLADILLSAGRWGVSAVASWVSDPARVFGGSLCGAPRAVLASARSAWFTRGAAPAQSVAEGRGRLSSHSVSEFVPQAPRQAGQRPMPPRLPVPLRSAGWHSALTAGLLPRQAPPFMLALVSVVGAAAFLPRPPWAPRAAVGLAVQAVRLHRSSVAVPLGRGLPRRAAAWVVSLGPWAVGRPLGRHCVPDPGRGPGRGLSDREMTALPAVPAARLVGPGAAGAPVRRASWPVGPPCWTLLEPGGLGPRWSRGCGDARCRRAGRRWSGVWGLILRVLDAFRPRKATWSGQVISSPPGPSGGPSKTHLLPGGGVPRVHRARSPVLPRRPRFATPRSVHQFAAVAAGAYPLRRPPNAWSPGAPAPPGPCYWLVASGTPLGWRGGCLA